eukprot:626363-Hanusia_phi.AAC.2
MRASIVRSAEGIVSPNSALEPQSNSVCSGGKQHDLPAVIWLMRVLSGHNNTLPLAPHVEDRGLS